jgi:DNA-binding transcriptional MerR regulator
MERSVITGFTEAQAARLTGVSLRQLRYWAADSFFAPSLTMPDLPHLPLYSFRDLVSLKVLNQLRNKEKIPLQELRRTKEAL